MKTGENSSLPKGMVSQNLPQISPQSSGKATATGKVFVSGVVVLKSILNNQVLILLIAILCCNLTWIAATRVELYWPHLVQLSAPMVVFGAALVALWRQAKRSPAPDWVCQRLYPLLQALLFLNFAWINMRVLNHLVMTTALPMRDDVLAQADVAIGFDWLGYFEFVHARPVLIVLMDTIYTSLTPLSVGAIVLLVAMGRLDRAALFLESFFIVAVICVVVGMAFPAVGTFVYYRLALADYPNFRSAPGTFWIEALARLREPEGRIVLDPLNLPGLAAFPSLHTAAAVVLAASFWQTRLGWGVALYAAAIVAATPIFGGHYGVDLIAGAMVAAVVFASVARRQRSGAAPKAWGTPAPATAR